MRESESAAAPLSFVSVARLALASVVRDEAARFGYTCRSLAELTGMSSATVNRCMMGKREISEYELGAFGAAFGWDGDARERVRRLWVTSVTGAGEVHHRDEVLDSLHKLTRESVIVAPWVLPPRLRTSGYHCLLTGQPTRPEHRRPWEEGQHTVVYLTRQAVTMPSALPAHQRAEQFAYLVDLAGREQVHLRFLPGQVTGVHGLEPFELVRLRNTTRYVRLDHHGMTTLLDNPGDVRTYRKVLDHLDSVAAPSHQWRTWLREH
ncbi:Scr1 family TA system antitoxin-like transcriptional regulator [Actinokineospora sp. PR83]|uniref:Scr1 family TA system antitoxin-like transcriptional regulator n=1 Tax=Actinokineospora sp. PR83 TaxID=2884908 RepID=UPI001F408A4B|nr:Scr1 family TA system antitoxin-like transcriptional regulator [Actinokineospora sp. PR83]MCG8919884.1 Scr1 family TA system antitoxin-like transcriptional regulator [Actinokineospora sp. PR83]